MIYGYARVSTQDQDLSGQIEKLTAAGCERIFKEKISGKNAERPELQALLGVVSSETTIIVTRLDRLARSTHDLWTILKLLDARGAKIRSLKDTWLDTTTAHGRLIITVMAGIAEFERELIKARTEEGRERARAAGRKLGGPPKKLDDGQIDNIVGLMRQGAKAADVAAQFGVSKRTIQRIGKAA